MTSNIDRRTEKQREDKNAMLGKSENFLCPECGANRTLLIEMLKEDYDVESEIIKRTDSLAKELAKLYPIEEVK